MGINSLREELVDSVTRVSYNRNAGLALDAGLALLCRRSAHRLLMATLKSKREAHRHVLLRRGVTQTRVWREMLSCSDPHLKWNAELLRPAFEIRVCPWTRASRFSWNATFTL